MIPTQPPSRTTLHMTGENSLIVGISFLQFDNARPKRPLHCRRGRLLSSYVMTPSSTTLSNNSTHHSQVSWRVGITAISPLISCRPCVTYSFIPFPFLDFWIHCDLAYIWYFSLGHHMLVRSWFHRQTSHVRWSSDRPRPAVWQFGHSLPDPLWVCT